MLRNLRIEGMVAEDGPRLGHLADALWGVRANRRKLGDLVCNRSTSGYQNVTNQALRGQGHDGAPSCIRHSRMVRPINRSPGRVPEDGPTRRTN